jgi:hypothetical protein
MLVGREFHLGVVRLRATRLSEPVPSPRRLTDERVLNGLVHRSGLQAQVLSDGVIGVGDILRLAEGPPD